MFSSKWENGNLKCELEDIPKLSVLLECRAKRVRITINNKMIVAEFKAWIGNEMGIWNVNWRIANVNWDIIELSVLLERRAKKVRITSNNKMIEAEFQAWISATDDIVCLWKRFETLDLRPPIPITWTCCRFHFVLLSVGRNNCPRNWPLISISGWHNHLKRCWEQERLKIKKNCDGSCKKNFDLYGTYLSTLNLNCQVLLQFSRAVNFPCSQKHGGPRCWINFQNENNFLFQSFSFNFYCISKNLTSYRMH